MRAILFLLVATPLLSACARPQTATGAPAPKSAAFSPESGSATLEWLGDSLIKARQFPKGNEAAAKDARTQLQKDMSAVKGEAIRWEVEASGVTESGLVKVKRIESKREFASKLRTFTVEVSRHFAKGVEYSPEELVAPIAFRVDGADPKKVKQGDKFVLTGKVVSIEFVTGLSMLDPQDAKDYMQWQLKIENGKLSAP